MITGVAASTLSATQMLDLYLPEGAGHGESQFWEDATLTLVYYGGGEVYDQLKFTVDK